MTSLLDPEHHRRNVSPVKQAKFHQASWLPTGIDGWLWLLLIFVLSVGVALRLEALDLTTTVSTVEGTASIPNTFASVDHPFHASRAETLRRSLADGEILRWVGNHQGGYPTEFYPLGVAWLEVGLWTLTLGLLSMAAVHKLTVILLFLTPGLAFGLMARRDQWSHAVTLIALALHLFIAGGPWQGGYTELVQWGLVTNVAASVALLFTLVWLTSYLQYGSGLAAAGAISASAIAILTNPRSLIALSAIGLGAWITMVVAHGSAKPAVRKITARLLVIGLTVALVAAPELVSLLRFSDLYTFLHYDGYGSLREYLSTSVNAVTLPVFLLGLGGVVIAGTSRTPVVSRAVAVTLLLYALATAIIATWSGDAGPLAQLEATRLMPFQRLLILYLAAVAIVSAYHLVWHRVIPFPTTAAKGTLATLIAVLLIIAMLSVDSDMPQPAGTTPKLSLYPVATTGAPEQADFADAVIAADARATPGTALLILNSTLSWHQQLWAPFWTDRQLLFNDWLWYWHPDHAGAAGYRFDAGHFYPDPSQALAADFLARQGIGAVIAGASTRSAAAASTALALVRSGIYDTYTVEAPTTVITFAGGNARDISIDNHRLAASGESPGGTAVIRRNWFPRWRATVNGQPSPIVRTADGSMAVAIPPGEVDLQLTYVVNRGDWAARVLSAIGVTAIVAIAGRDVLRRRASRPAHPSSHEPA